MPNTFQAKGARHLRFEAFLGATLFLTLLAGILAHSLYQSRQDAEMGAAFRAQTMARLLAVRIGALGESTKLWLDELERHIDPDELASDSMPTEQHLLHLDRWVDDIKRQNPDIGNLGFLDFRGRAYLLRGPQRTNVSLADTGYWKDIQALGAEGRGRNFLSEPYVFKTTGKLGMVFARGIYAADGRVLGGVVVGVHLEQLSEILELADTGRLGATVMFDDKMRMLGRWPKVARNDRDLIALSLLVDKGPLEDTFFKVSDVDQVERLIATAKIKSMPISVAVGLAPAEYLATWRDYARTVSISFLIMLALTVVVVRLWLRTVSVTNALKHMVVTDRLTGIFNRRFLDMRCAQELASVKRSGGSFSLILTDVDHFKSINDEHGHQTGDAVLVAIANTLRSALRATDVVGRWGGEEFMVVCPDTELAGALTLAEKLREAVQDQRIPGVHNITASFGCAAFTQADSVDAIVLRADEALYKAKSGGRNRVVGSDRSSAADEPATQSVHTATP